MRNIFLSVGRTKQLGIDMICEYYNFNKEMFNDLKQRQFIFEHGGDRFIFVKPREMMSLAFQSKLSFDCVMVIPNDEFYNFRRLISFTKSTNEAKYINYEKFNILKSVKMGDQRLSLIGKPDLNDISHMFSPYNNLLYHLFKKDDINFNPEFVNHLECSLEVMPLLLQNTAIVDIVETGKTLKEHGLKEIKKLMDIEMFIVKRKDMF